MSDLVGSLLCLPFVIALFLVSIIVAKRMQSLPTLANNRAAQDY